MLMLKVWSKSKGNLDLLENDMVMIYLSWFTFVTLVKLKFIDTNRKVKSNKLSKNVYF